MHPVQFAHSALFSSSSDVRTDTVYTYTDTTVYIFKIFTLEYRYFSLHIWGKCVIYHELQYTRFCSFPARLWFSHTGQLPGDSADSWKAVHHLAAMTSLSFIHDFSQVENISSQCFYHFM